MIRKKGSVIFQNKTDKIYRSKFASQEIESTVLSIFIEVRATLIPKKYFIKKLTSKISVRNHCLISGRKRSVFAKMKLSRLAFRKLTLSGTIPGIQKACW